MTAQGMYYLIRALVTLIAIPFHEGGPRAGRLSCWATLPQSGRAASA